VPGTTDADISLYLGAYLEEVRKSKGRTREQVAAAAGLSTRSVAIYEGGSQRMAFVVFLRICLYLDINPAQLVCDILDSHNIEPL